MRSTSATESDVPPGASARPGEPPARELPSDELPIRETIARLVAAGKDLVDAEVAWAKARTTFITAAARTALIYGAVAFFLAFALIVALLVGAVLALAPVIGIGLALLVVTIGALVLIGLCALVIRSQVRRITGALK